MKTVDNCHDQNSWCVFRKGLCVSLGHPRLVPAFGLVGVKELLFIREAAYTDLINSTRIKLLLPQGPLLSVQAKFEQEVDRVMGQPQGNELNQL